jgi:predicted nucleotidyltransferase component of viral defense system
MPTPPNPIERVKHLTLEALFTDDIFMSILVLKGGNALNLAYNLSERGSIDIDFSMAGDFSPQDLERMQNNAASILNTVFEREGFHAFDVKLVEKPKKINNDVKDFWGGYELEFKLIGLEQKQQFDNNIEAMRRNAIALHDDNSTKFTVDISRYEHIGNAQTREIDGVMVQVYSPEMLAIEKLRALCQQTVGYKAIIGSMTPKSRARDFYDIYNILQSFPGIDVTSPQNVELTRLIFDAKRVPLAFVSHLPDTREHHRLSWEAVKQTIAQDQPVLDFDFYFDYVMAKFAHLI